MNGGGVVRPLPEDLIEAHVVPRTPDIKITVRMTEQRMNKEQIRVGQQRATEQQALFYVTRP